MTTILRNCDNSMLFCQRKLIFWPLEARLKQCIELLEEKEQQFRKSMYARGFDNLENDNHIDFRCHKSKYRNQKY